MKISKTYFCYLLTLTFLTLLFSNPVCSQNKLMGEITVSGTTESFVIVNGERVISGRTIMSPADISTSAGASAKITLPNTGTILISPNTKLKLFFVNAGISGDLTNGEVIFETAPGAMLSILTTDGTTTVPETNQTNVVKMTVSNGATRVNTLVGKANFNTVTVNAGEYFPAQSDNPPPPKQTSKSGGGLLLILLIGGAAAAAAVLGLTAAGGGNNNSTPVSPVV